MLRIAPLLLVVLAGCTGCQPLLEIKHIGDLPEDATPRTWTQADADTWPDVDRLLRGVPADEHAHADWSEERRQAFWTHYGLDPATDNDLFVRLGQDTYRIRVLTCD